MDPREEELRRLREENAGLRSTISTLEFTISALRGSVVSLESSIHAQAKAFEDQKTAFEKTLAELQSLQRRYFGPKSEKMPTPKEELRRRKGTKPSPEERAEKRRRNAERRLQVRTERIVHRVSHDKLTCPKCGRANLRALGEGRKTRIWEYVPGYFVCQEHVQETLTCACGDYVTMADVPLKAFENGRYGPHFIAHVIVAKCLDAIPHHRLEKMFERLGIPMSRSTITDLFHRAAEMLAPLVTRLFALIAASEIVQADETSIKVQKPEKRGFLWTFLAQNMIAYRFSLDRSGETPKSILGGTKGILVIDGYTGYNQVIAVDGRIRAGCLAHARRKIFEAREMAPDAADHALDLILQIYEVEHDAKDRGIVGTQEHLALRRERSRPITDKLHTWLVTQQELHPPRSKMGVAIRYALKSWRALTVFLNDPCVPVDNNASERALRAAALGRRNFLFVGNERTGQNLAALYSLVATCRANGIHPETYLADVLLRIHKHPASRIDEILPQNWAPISA